MARYTTGLAVGYNIYGDPADFAASHGTAFVFGTADQRLPFMDATFDQVVSLNIMEHVRDLEVRVDSRGLVSRSQAA